MQEAATQDNQGSLGQDLALGWKTKSRPRHRP